ncbi:hypothetical protein BC937DRAFT_89829 [Endogone sp. FLAS-F59071]|nr:hypothetical protein BC937DRAFT_89829 [Endogone sp. FLAS-F59071]|eukprot:RUS17545.1 hypothetical protein BC937DRAFT_89829 [Endogone sp. FLAS-F59071]
MSAACCRSIYYELKTVSLRHLNLLPHFQTVVHTMFTILSCAQINILQPVSRVVGCTLGYDTAAISQFQWLDANYRPHVCFLHVVRAHPFHFAPHGRTVGILARTTSSLVRHRFQPFFLLTIGGFSEPGRIVIFLEVTLSLDFPIISCSRCRVEFNNKFYRGTGVKFQPFSFKTVISSRAD